jgi:hypothetical protein
MEADRQLAIRWVSTVDEIPSELWAQCFPPPLEGRWWYQVLEHSGLDAQFTFAYAVIERDAAPVGVAPTFLMDVPIDLVAPPMIARLLRLAGGVLPRLRYQRTLFVGSPCSDEGTVGLLPGVQLAEAAPLLQTALERRAQQLGAPMLVWKDFPRTDDAALSEVSKQRGLFRIVSYPGTSLSLPAGGFDAYLQTLTSSHRHNLRKKLRRSKALSDLSAAVLQQPSGAVLEEIFALFWQTYQKGKTKFEQLTPKFFQHIAAEEVAYFVLLRHPTTNQLVAFMLCFLVGSRVINKFIGLDYRFGGDWFLYFRLWEQAIDWASRQNVTEFQSGQTGYRAKLDLGHNLIPLYNYCRHRNPVLHRLFAYVARSISWATLDTDLARHALNEDCGS